jgi:tetratricopeptide (TPR) repeat protein
MGFDLQDILDRAKGSVRVGDHAEAERLLKQYLAKEPDDRAAHLLLGTTLAKAEKIKEAEDEFTTMVAKDPQDVEALNNLAVIYRRQERYQEALGTLMDAIEVDPTRAEFHYNIGNINKQLGNLKAAAMAYAKVVELNPSYVHAYNNLGTIYDQLHEYDRAFNMFKKGLSLDRNNPTLHFNYGVALEANGRLDDALNEYQASLRSKPGWFQAMNNVGIIYFKQGNHAKAVETFNKILQADSNNAEALNNIGVVQADQGKTKEAMEKYRQAIEADPKYIKAVINLERAMEDSGDLADAIIELEKIIKLVPTSTDLSCRLASLYVKLERFPEALQQAKTALDWEPENIQALRIMGTTQRMTKRDADAQKTFEKILTLDPGNYGFQLDLADIHFKRKEFTIAEKYIKSFLTRRPTDRKAKMLLGRLYAAMGNKPHAIQVFAELSSTDPTDSEALTAMAELHKDSGETEKALRTADQLVNLQGQRATADDLTGLNESLEMYENAVKAYTSEAEKMWEKNLQILQEAVSEETAEPTPLLLSAGENETYVDEETETLFIEDPELGLQEEETETLPLDNPLDNEMPLIEEEHLPTMTLDNLAEGGGDTWGDAPFESQKEPSFNEAPQAPAAPQAPVAPPVPQYPPPPQYQQPLPPPAMPAAAPAAFAPPPAPEPVGQPPAPPAQAEPDPFATDTEPFAVEPVQPAPQAQPSAPALRADAPSMDGGIPEEEPFGTEEPFGVEETAEGGESEGSETESESPFAEADAEQESPFTEEEAPSETPPDKENIFAEDTETFDEPALPPEPQPSPQGEGSPLEPTALPIREPSPNEKPLGEDSGFNRKTLVELMSHLQEMAESLPKEKQEEFKKNPMRSTFEKVLDALRGKKRNKDTDSSGFSPEVKKKMRKSLAKLEKLSRKKNLSGKLDDDPGFFAMLRQKAQSIMTRIKSVTDKRN